jgi:RHS repeat-associated protein
VVWPSWHGSILRNKQDGSGLEYMRNRVYDPKSGRFTQEDPIGLAGGLNLYGFANGDPLTFSDPFGLCPERARNVECKEFTGAAAQQAFQQLRDRLTPAQPVLELALSPLLFAPFAGGEAAIAGLGLSGGTAFYRGVSAAEAADVALVGALRAGAVASGNAGKCDTRSASDSAKWGVRLNGDAAQLLKIRVPADALAKFEYMGRRDGIGGAWWAPIEAFAGARVRSIGSAQAKTVP